MSEQRYPITRQSELRLCQQAQQAISRLNAEVEQITTQLVEILAADAGLELNEHSDPRFESGLLDDGTPCMFLVLKELGESSEVAEIPPCED